MQIISNKNIIIYETDNQLEVSNIIKEMNNENYILREFKILDKVIYSDGDNKFTISIYNLTFEKENK